MNPHIWDIGFDALDPDSRRLLKSKLMISCQPIRWVISGLIGQDASARFNFIMERTEYASEINV